MAEPFVRPGDLVRFVSPASRPDPNGVETCGEILRRWGLRVDIAPHAFAKLGYLAGSDDDRLADLADALREPSVRAVFATRGGKGSYRIAERLPFDAIARDSKPIVGFSDITALHLMLWRQCRTVTVHGALTSEAEGLPSEKAAGSLRRVLMEVGPFAVEADPTIGSAALTTSGRAQGPLIGGNLDMIGAAAGWALPSLRGAILLLESNGLGIGHFDRILSMLVKAGHLDGIVGVVVGHVDGTPPNPPISAMSLLQQYFEPFAVPILGGLPIGHHAKACSVLVGAKTLIDADAGTLVQKL
jgi:muramoyltetrapeptide carboxypeptidase